MNDSLKTTIDAVEAANAPKAIEATPDATPAVTGEEVTTEDQGTSDNGQPPAKPELTELEKAEHAFRRKINKLTRRVGERDMRLAELEERLQQQQGVPQQVQQKPAQQDGRPTLEAYDFDQAAFQEALVDWKLKERDRTAESAKRRSTLAEKETAFAALNPDYEDVAKAPHVPITQSMAEAIFETDNPPAVAYYLGQHLEEAAAIAAMAPIAAARAIGRIEASLSSPQASTTSSPPRTVTNAPAVASSVNARAPVAKPLANMSVEDHIEALRVKSKR